MIERIIKRDGKEVKFCSSKIVTAISKAMSDTEKGVDADLASRIAETICKSGETVMHVEDVQDMVEAELMSSDRKDVAQQYIRYRDRRNVARKAKLYNVFSDIILAKSNDVTRENANMNADTPAGMMMKFASESSKPFTEDYLLSPAIKDAVANNYIHIHDKDYYPTKSLTCVQHPLDKILQGGFEAGHGASRPAKRIETASILGCISMETVQNEMHGGQAIPAFDFYLAPYVRRTFVEELKSLEQLYGRSLEHLYNAEIEDYIKAELDGLEGDVKCVQFAINQTVARVYQALEAFVHNMNTIHSRGGNQVVFSSVNYGTDTSAEGRCIIREMLNTTYKGVGNGSTAIFPIQIWKKKKGVNYLPEDRNYDLYKQACRVTARRFFPNFVNLDAPFNQHEKWDINDPERYKHEVATMGCVDGEEVITYKHRGTLYVESFRRMWNRVSECHEVKEQNEGDGRNLYIDAEDVEIYDTLKGFVKVNRVVRNTSDKWVMVKSFNGRSLLCTADHPFHTNRGRVYAADLVKDDGIRIGVKQFHEDLADMNDSEIEDMAKAAVSDKYVPSEAFFLGRESRYKLWLNIICLIQNEKGSVFKSKEFAMQCLALYQTLPNSVGRIEEKTINGETVYEFSSAMFSSYDVIESVTEIDRTAFSYDVETESDHFEVSGIYSHNCRTRVFENRFGDKTSIGRGNLSFTTVNIVRIALECMAIEDKAQRLKAFYSKLDEVLDIAAQQLDERFNFQKTALAKQFPLLMSGLWVGSENLKPDDTIEPVINQGTLGIGFIGLAECLIALVGKHHGESEEAQKLGLEIVSHMREKVVGYSEKYQHNYSVLATPAEGLSGRFTKFDKKKFGTIPGITDKEYYTNSNHVPVYFKCSAKRKAEIEAPYHALTGGGHIFYVEMDGDVTHNPEAVMRVVDIMDRYNVGYGSVNHNRNRCMSCGYENAAKELHECPVCGSKDIDKLQRITGYLVGTTDRWNAAKLAELNDRVSHN